MVDSAKWGQKRWSGVQYDYSSVSANSHPLRTRVGIDTKVRAAALGVTHHLKTTARIDTRVVSIGYGPKAIHSIKTVAAIDTLAKPAPLKFGHTLSTKVVIAAATQPARLRFGHTLHTVARIDTQTFGRLGIPHYLTTRAAIATAASAAPLRIGHSLKTKVRVVTRARATGITELQLPTIVELLSPVDPTLYVVGILNIIPNPAVVTTLEGWEPYGDASLIRDAAKAWYGDHSAFLSVPLVGTGGMTIQAAQGMMLAPYGGSILWSGVRLATSGAGLQVSVHTRAKYVDGTVVDGDAVVVPVTADGEDPGSWDLVQAPYLLLDDTKLLSTAWVVIEPTASVGSSPTLSVGAAQMEYDLMMYGPAKVVALEATA